MCADYTSKQRAYVAGCYVSRHTAAISASVSNVV